MPKVRKHPAHGIVALCAWLLALPLHGAETHDLFWSLDDGNGHAGYLMGTVHSEDARVLEFTDEFLERLGACEIFAMELVPDLPTMQRLMSYMQLPEGESLANRVGGERFERLQGAMAGYGVPPAQLDRMKPWAAMMTLSLPPPKTGLFLDFSLSLRAAGSGLEVEGLETLEQQLSFLEALDLSDQLELLDQALEDHDRVQEVHDQMVDTYLAGDLSQLQEVADAQMDGLPPETRAWFEQEGIAARNHRMADSAVALLDRGCAFIAVGALHLPGDEGLITLLRRAGYELSPLPSPFPWRPEDA